MKTTTCTNQNCRFDGIKADFAFCPICGELINIEKIKEIPQVDEDLNDYPEGFMPEVYNL